MMALRAVDAYLPEIEKIQARFPFPVYVNPIQFDVLKGTGSA
jgi:hypothetical protein